MPATKKENAGRRQKAVRRQSRGKLPVKRSINLAVVNEKRVNFGAVLLLALVILAGAAVLTKVTFIDPMRQINALRRETSELQRQLDEGNARITALESLEEVYAHYTWSNMTAEELGRPDYVAAMDLLERVVMSRMTLDAWTLNENTLTLSINGSTLQAVNMIAEELNSDEHVNYCTVTTAALNNYTTSSENVLEEEMVRANMVIYLKPAERGQTQ